MKPLKIFSIVCFLSASLTFGHVGIDYPKGGESFEAGDLINIQWHIDIDHGDCDWDLLFSSDGGNTWSSIANNLSKGQLEYEWTITAKATNQGKVKVVQDNQIGADYDAVSGDFTINSTTGIISNDDEVKEFSIYPAFPNPFNNSTVISFNLPEQDQVKITIFNIAGEEIETLLNSEIPARFHWFRWDEDDVPSGVYLYTVETKQAIQTKKVILIK